MENPIEKTLNELADLSRAILNSLRDHVAVLDARGVILAVNKAWERFALENGALDTARVSVGANYLEICRRATKAGDPVAQQALIGLESLLNGTTDHFAMDYECSSPLRKRWFTMTILRQKQPSAGAIVTHSDITERKQAEEKIRQSLDKLSTIIAGADVGSWDWNIQAGTVDVNERFCTMLGYEPGSVGADVRRFFDSLHPDDAEKVNRAVEAHFAGESQLYRCDFRLRTADGSYKWIHDAGKLIERDHQGRPLRMVGIHIDLTEEKRVEAALKASEEEFRSMFELAGVGKAQADPTTGQFTRVNMKFCEMTGYSGEELLAMTFRDITHPDDRERDESAVQRVLKGETNFWSIEKRYLRKDGAVLWVHVNGTLIKSKTGPSRTIANVVDITERKRSEEALNRAYKEIQVLKERLEAENVYLREEINVEHGFENIIGQSDATRYVLYRVQQVASTDATVFILGETGTGKGLVARAIHQASKRKDRPMVHVNCAVLPGNLIESELFGREKGAFTGALTRQIGRFELADKGTIFLDEIGELPIELQAKLLKVIEECEFERLGSPYPVKVDVRIIASTNRNLEEEIGKGRFRQDLFYRLNVFPITVPPLRQRREDIPAIVEYLINKVSKGIGKQVTSIPRAVMKTLQDYRWPGNVRELQNVIERAVITSPGPVLQLAEPLQASEGGQSSGRAPGELGEMERSHILMPLQASGWKIEGPEGAAQALGLNPSTLRTRMKKLGIRRPSAS